MGHTPPPLKIGVKNGCGYAEPPPPRMFEREIGQVVEVKVETACSVRFDCQDIFSNKDYSRPQNDTWIPNYDDNQTATFEVFPYCADRLLSTHSIKIGSGGFTVRKKAKAKAKNKAKKSKLKESTKKTTKSRKRSS